MDYLLFTQIGFILLSAICLVFIIKGIKIASIGMEIDIQRRILKRFYIAIAIWFLFLTLVSLTGIISNFDTLPPRFVIVVIPPIVLLIILWRSKLMVQLLRKLPMKYMLNLQAFRIVVEIFLWLLFLENVLPIQMTFEGINFDVLVGLTGPIAAWFLLKNKKLAKKSLLIWNVSGLLLLGNIVVVAILSTPSPLRLFMNEPANRIITEFPVVLLPGFLVPMAYYLHFFSIRQILMSEK